MKKLILSCALLFAVATVGTVYAQDGGCKKSCAKTECCAKKDCKKGCTCGTKKECKKQ